MRRALLALALVAGVLPVVLADPAAAWPSITRVAGASRYDTAARVATSHFATGVERAYVATGEGYADALVGAAAAGRFRSPVLLVHRSGVPAETAAALDKLAPKQIVVLGGTTVIPDAVLDKLEQHTSGTVRRMAGGSRYDTAAAASADAFATYSKAATVFLVNGQGFADALGAGALAARSKMPLLLTLPDAVPDAIARELRRLQPVDIIVVGGPSAVSEHLVKNVLPQFAGRGVQRWAGGTRYETAVRVAELAWSPKPAKAFLATGETFPDALAAGAAAGAVGAPILLSQRECMADVTQAYLASGVSQLVVLGGTGAVSDRAAGGATDCPRPPAAPAPRYGGSTPITAAFYYGWFPSGWDVPGTRWTPTHGRYSTQDEANVRRQVEDMRYGGIKAGIASWWGPDRGPSADYAAHVTDRSLAVGLRAAENTPFTWGIYYEDEGYGNPSVEQLRADLDYIRAKYVNHPNFLWMDGKPVVFVWPEPSDGCAMAARWRQAAPDFYVVQKRFAGWTNCQTAPSSWHEYAPGLREISNMRPWSYSVSPGYYQYNESAPRLARDPGAFDAAVGRMKASGAHWQLVTTFNEWGEGTSVESAQQWASPSGRGVYLDILNRHYGRF